MARSVTITLDHERTLRFDINALADADELLGERLLSVLIGEATMGIFITRGLLWAGLRGDDPKLTLAATGNLIQAVLERGGNLSDINQKITEAIRSAGIFRGAEKNAQPEAPKGSASGDG